MLFEIKLVLDKILLPIKVRYVHTTFSISLYLLIVKHSAHGFNLILRNLLFDVLEFEIWVFK
jgi:hypothetical protein